jgi:K+-sensing histidine kinase KdpD
MSLGLSVCYGIVHEHDGEISAFNLHPHGAAVAVELPVAVADKKSEVASGTKAYSASV